MKIYLNPYNRPSPTGHISYDQYLRTVIVTADIDGGLYHPALAHHRYLTFPHWSGVTSYTSTYVFAGSCVFGKQSLGKLSLRPPSLYFQKDVDRRELISITHVCVLILALVSVRFCLNILSNSLEPSHYFQCNKVRKLL